MKNTHADNSSRSSLIRAGCLLALFATGCDRYVSMDQGGAFTVTVEVQEGDLGAPDARLPTTDGSGEWPERQYRLKVEALDAKGARVESLTRPLHVRVVPGQVVLDEARGFTDQITMNAGVGEAVVAVSHIYGDTRIWAEDLGTSEEPGSYATGVSPTLYVQAPTISDIQYVPRDQECLSYVGTTLEGYECAALASTFVRVRAADRLLVVTAITTSGFYVTDCIDAGGPLGACQGAAGQYNSMYAFSYSAPDGVFPGAVLESLAGNVSEFNGSTQLSFPDWVLAPGEQVDPPEPEVLSEQIYCSSDSAYATEPYESDLVRVENLVIKDFASDSYDLGRFNRFGQWPAIFVSTLDTDAECEIAVVTRETMPDFDPLANPGAALDFVQGNLTTYASVYSDVIQWTVLTRTSSDLGCATGICRSSSK